MLITSAYPTLRLYVYGQGLVRFATVKYEQPNEGNVKTRKMFLTNYAVNKATGLSSGNLGDDNPDEDVSGGWMEGEGGEGDSKGGGAHTHASPLLLFIAFLCVSSLPLL